MQLKESFLLNIEKNGVANLIFDLQNEKVNKLSSLAMTDLERAISVIDGNKAIRVLVITSAKANNFIAGADINEIKSINNREDALQKVKRGQDILNKIANLKIPSIAVINGSCLGGGLELALACSYRVAIINKKTILGLPEVNLGIIPGFGGTQRLPKLIGLKNSLNLILSGKSIDAKLYIKKIIKTKKIKKIHNAVFQISCCIINKCYRRTYSLPHNSCYRTETLLTKYPPQIS